MFAYCGNEPVERYDPTGGSLIDIIADIIVFLVQSEKNRALDEDDATTTRNTLILNQHDSIISQFNFGIVSASFSACEAIAIHNAKCLLGIDTTLSTTIDVCFSIANTFHGVLGSDPLKLGLVLSVEGINYSIVSIDGLRDPGLYIISYWTEYGSVLSQPVYSIHTVTVEYDGSNYTTYNRRGSQHDSPFEYAELFIIGYKLTDYNGGT